MNANEIELLSTKINFASEIVPVRCNASPDYISKPRHILVLSNESMSPWHALSTLEMPLPAQSNGHFRVDDEACCSPSWTSWSLAFQKVYQL